MAFVPCPVRRLARRSGGSAGSVCGTPIFPRVLVHLAGLDRPVVQRHQVGGLPRLILGSVPELQ